MTFNPYSRHADIPGPYAAAAREQEERERSKSSDRSDNSQSASAAAVLRSDGAALQTAGDVYAPASSAAGRAAGASSSAAAAGASQAAASTSGLAAAHALVHAMMAAVNLVNAAMSAVTAAVSAAVAAAGPFVALAVAKTFGLTDAASAAKAAVGVSEDTANALAAEISNLTAAHSDEAQAQLIARAETLSQELVQGLAAHQTYVQPVAHAEGGPMPENATGPAVTIAVDVAGGPGSSLRLADTHGGLFELQGNSVIITRPFDFEADGSVSGDVIVSNAGGWETHVPFTVTPTNVNEVPAVTSAGGASIAENSAAVFTVTGTDPDAGTVLTYAVAGGEDAAKFTVDARTGELRFVDAPDYEAPTDVGHDNVYHVTVQASDGELVATKAVAVTVSNVNEAPMLRDPVATFDGHTLTIRVDAVDPDGQVIAPLSYTYTVQQLAAGVPSFTVDVTDAGGLHSNVMAVDPPKLAAEASAAHPVAPTILGIDLTTLPENQGAVAHVTAWDAIDGMLTKSISVTPQDYEALPTHAITLHADLVNSLGLHAQANFQVRITDVNENHNPVIDSVVIAQPGPGSWMATIDVHDPDGESSFTYQVANAFHAGGAHFVIPVPPGDVHIAVFDGHGGAAFYNTFISTLPF